jgi:hypothetical protein
MLKLIHCLSEMGRHVCTLYASLYVLFVEVVYIYLLNLPSLGKNRFMLQSSSEARTLKRKILTHDSILRRTVFQSSPELGTMKTKAVTVGWGTAFPCVGWVGVGLARLMVTPILVQEFIPILLFWSFLVDL